MAKTRKLKFGLIINPVAGIGGKVGLKGSDGEAIREEAFARGAVPQSINRARMALEPLQKYVAKIDWFTVSGVMGADLLQELGFSFETVSTPADLQAKVQTESIDTIQAVEQLNQKELDLLIFVGGDGTARNVCEAVNESQVVLGIPAGVKIHSGVYAITPQAAGKVMEQVILNELVSLIEASVMDIDEEAFRTGVVRAKRFGQMLVPAEHQYIQATKVSSSQLGDQSSKEHESLVQSDIAEYLVENMDDDYHYLIGSGTSCAAIMDALDLPNTLLGIDWVYQEELMGSDLTEQDILNLMDKYPNRVKVIITIIGGQGHILGRGNQQLSAKVMAKLDKNNLIIIATKTKINQLNGKPLVVDTDNPEINQKFSGLFRVVAGYEDEIYYQVGLEK